MKTLSLTLLVLLSVNINSCKSKKATANAETKVETMNKFIEDGYSKATIVFDKTKSEPCNYLIQLEKGELLEPRKIMTEQFKTNNQKIWIKFIRQRRMSRCSNAQPVELIEIIVR